MLLSIASKPKLEMEQVYNFDDIRPYRDDEVQAVLLELTREPKMLALLSKLLPHIPVEKTVEILQQHRTIADFQKHLVHTYVHELEAVTTKGVEFIGCENLDKSKAYLFISNHRDIVLDSAFLNSTLLRLDYPLTEIAIGDNLLIYPWIKALVRLNRSFIVQRNVPVRQMLEISKQLSAYIRHTLTERNQSIWIAQREGRAKDSNDRTQESVLKMFNISGEKDVISNLQELSFCPTTISYEFDPCDYLKAKEFQQKRDNPDFKKAPQDDLINMETGIKGFKGKVVYAFSGDIKNELEKLRPLSDNKTEQFALAASLIDKCIHKNYYIFSNNKVAYDLLLGTDKFAGEYDIKDKSSFETYMQMQIDKIDLPNKDEAFLRTKMLEMYANPLINYLKAKES